MMIEKPAVLDDLLQTKGKHAMCDLMDGTSQNLGDKQRDGQSSIIRWKCGMH